jgi:hypothetical protein
MRSLLVVLFFVFAFELVLADTAPSPSPVASPVVVATTPSPALALTAADPVVVKDTSAAPPIWMQDVLVSIKKLPMVGPLVVKVLNWLGVLCSILTALAAFVMVVLKALTGVLNVAQLTELSAKVQAFQDGKILYWLKYLSMFNAQKPDAPADQAPQAKA